MNHSAFIVFSFGSESADATHRDFLRSIATSFSVKDDSCTETVSTRHAAVVGLSATAFVYAAHPVRSSDHQDAPAVLARPGADITYFRESSLSRCARRRGRRRSGHAVRRDFGYEPDAQFALGAARDAAATRDLIFAIERLGNAYHVNDRLLAIYYADHHLRPDDALAIARREVAVRGDEIYAQDTLAWGAAMDGRWGEARTGDSKAMRLGTHDPLLAYHAAIIAMHFGDRVSATRLFERALRENPDFHPTFADDARSELFSLNAS